MINNISKSNLYPQPVDNKNDTKKLKKLTKDFEAIFIAQMFKTMRAAVPKNGLLNGGYGEDVFQSMMDQELSNSLANKTNTGISETMYRQLTGNKNNV